MAILFFLYNSQHISKVMELLTDGPRPTIQAMALFSFSSLYQGIMSLCL